MAENLSRTLTWAEFFTVYDTYDKDGNGYIQDEELDMFLHDLKQSFGDKIQDVCKDVSITDGKIDQLELAMILHVEEENFVRQFRQQSRDAQLTFVDFIKIWKHYDFDRSGYLDGRELEAFYLDLFSNKDRKTVQGDDDLAVKVKAMAKATIDRIGGDDKKVSIREMASFLPVEKNFLSGKPTNVGDNLDKVFKDYDKVEGAWGQECFHGNIMDNSGCIDLGELAVLLKDLGLEDGKKAGNLEELFNQLDENKDGKIQKSELQLLFKI